MEGSDDQSAADVFDFIDEYLSDVEHGREHPLVHYLARFPRHADSIAREYLALKSPGPPSGVLADETPRDESSSTARSAREDERRIGPYRLLRELGRGGQGAVFLAEDSRIARRVALKILASRFDMVSEERLKRFRREAEVISRLEHPNICGIYDADIDGETPWIAMRFVEGETLAATLDSARRAASASKVPPSNAPVANASVSEAHAANAPVSKVPVSTTKDSSDVTSAWPPRSPLDVHRVLLLFERSARALHAAHEAGVIHRDVKPGNIMVTREGKPMLLDFGLARDEQSEVSGLTQTGDVFGTPAYMSPEQLSGGSEALDRRTDVYSLGVALYEALTLARPFEAPTRMSLYGAIQSELPPPDPRRKNKSLSEDVKVVLETALDKDRARRYPTALDFAEDLRRIREYEPVHARPAGVGLRFARWTRRHPALAVTIIGTILALSCGLALSLVMLAREQAALEREMLAVAVQNNALQTALGRHLAERSNALISEDPSASLALAIDAVKRAPNYLTRSALFTALDACYLERVLEIPEVGPARRITDLALSSDGARAAAGWDDGSTRIFDLSTGKMLANYPGERNEIVFVRWSGDGRFVASATGGGRLCVRDAASGDIVHSSSAEAFVQIEFDADSSHLLALSGAGHATIWNTKSWRPEAELDQGEGGIARACFVPGPPRIRRVLTIAGANHAKARTATLWDALDGRALLELGGAGDSLSWCDVSLDPRRALALTTCKDGRVRVYDLVRGARTATLVHDAPVAFACFSPNGAHLFAATEVSAEEGSAHLWNLATDQDTLLANHAGRRVTHAAFDPDGSRLATACVDLGVRIWSTSDGREEHQYRALFRPVSVHWTPDGRRLVSRANGRVAHVWSAVNHPDVLTLRGHEKCVNSTMFSPDGTLALTASDDGSARVWFVGDNGATPARLRAKPCSDASGAQSEGTRSRSPLLVDEAPALADEAPALAHEAPVIVDEAPPLKDRSTVLAEGSTALKDRATVVAAATASGPSPTSAHAVRDPGSLMLVLQHAGRVASASFSPDGEEILTVSDDRTAMLWSARTGKPVRGALQHPGAVSSGAWSKDGARVLTTCADGLARIWGVQESEPIVLCTEAAGVTCARFDPASRLVAVGTEDDVLRLFDATTGELVAALAFTHRNPSPGGISDVAFHPNGEEVAAACGDNTVRLWNISTRSASRPDIQLSPPHNLCFSSDGARLLIIGRFGGGAVRVQDLHTNQSVRHPEIRHTDDITCGSFSRDGRYVLTASKDTTAYVWDAESGQPIAHRMGHLSPIACAEFSCDAGDPRVITGSEDGTVSIWPVDPLPAAENRKPRDLYDWEKAREMRLASPLEYD